MARASDLIKQGRQDELWQEYCGFLDLTLDEFMEIQERLLLEQLQLARASSIGQVIMGDNPPTTIEGFREQVPLTTYTDYAAHLNERNEDVLGEEIVAWAHTSGRSGEYKWAPYSARAFEKIGEGVLTAAILCAARKRGEVRIEPKDVFVYNAPARPYMSGYALLSLAELFDFEYAPPIDQTEEMSFRERIEASFQVGLRTGIDVIGSISSVLVKVGEGFSEGAGSRKLSASMLHPAVIMRLGRALVRSKLEGRGLLPRDLWKVKGVLVGGSDTNIYRDLIREYWGAEPHEQYACTEAPNIISTQAWDRKGMYFLPSVCFYEFIPEAEWEKARNDPDYTPRTVLLDEVEVGPRYEVVITNFYGGPFLRYRLHDLIRFVSLADQETGIQLPSMAFSGRDADLIDLAGFTGLIDEQLIWQAIANTGIGYVDWTARKEVHNTHAGIHLYIETKEPVDEEECAEAVHQELKKLNTFYADLEHLLELRPLQVSRINPGTFQAYMEEKARQGADLAHIKPMHMNPTDEVMELLLSLHNEMPVTADIQVATN